MTFSFKVPSIRMIPAQISHVAALDPDLRQVRPKPKFEQHYRVHFKQEHWGTTAKVE